MKGRLKLVLKKLFKKGYLTEKEIKDNNYDLIAHILEKDKKSKNKLNKLNNQIKVIDNETVVLEAFCDMINDKSIIDAYSKDELLTVYNNVIAK